MWPSKPERCSCKHLKVVDRLSGSDVESFNLKLPFRPQLYERATENPSSTEARLDLCCGRPLPADARFLKQPSPLAISACVSRREALTHSVDAAWSALCLHPLGEFPFPHSSPSLRPSPLPPRWSQESDAIVRRTQALVRRGGVQKSAFHSASHAQLARPMLEAVGWPLVATFAVTMEDPALPDSLTLGPAAGMGALAGGAHAGARSRYGCTGRWGACWGPQQVQVLSELRS